MAKAEKISFTTAIVTFIYPKLNEPDVYTPKRGKPGKPKFKTDWSEKDEAAETALQTYLKKVAKKLCPDADFGEDAEGKSKFGFPWKKNKDGETVFTASTGMTNKAGVLIRPPVFDAKKQAIPVSQSIGGGTKGRLKVTVGVYPDEDGITLYIDQIQITELVESTYGQCAFDEADGFSYKGVGEADENLESTDLSSSEDKGDDEDFDVAF
ncbi:hypothetical protein HU230_0012625 [Bradyrhizobium quebecense]|uniref:Single-stranded DNA-binding protein n=1 Tax=Bradyrhizobium quebecense TaxID=2748629 RepID=A0A973WMP3_9BRAD|nr:hypothetical protein [Bradyrhizobium quebecense]UGA46834.1 hypothetical protein HU230_0012625 [Bradyrhizobium quebecense]